MGAAAFRSSLLPADTYKQFSCFFKHIELTMFPGLKSGTPALLPLLPVGALAWLLSTGRGDLCVPLADLEQNW